MRASNKCTVTMFILVVIMQGIIAPPAFAQKAQVRPVVRPPAAAAKYRAPRTADGKPRLRAERITLLRRGGGLSPAQVLHDASGPSAIARAYEPDSTRTSVRACRRPTVAYRE